MLLGGLIMTDFSTIKKLFGIEKSEGFSEECVKFINRILGDKEK